MVVSSSSALPKSIAKLNARQGDNPGATFKCIGSVLLDVVRGLSGVEVKNGKWVVSYYTTSHFLNFSGIPVLINASTFYLHACPVEKSPHTLDETPSPPVGD